MMESKALTPEVSSNEGHLLECCTGLILHVHENLHEKYSIFNSTRFLGRILNDHNFEVQT